MINSDIVKKASEAPIKVLMVAHTSAMTGPNTATISLLRMIDRDNFKIEVASPKEGYFVDRLKDIGISHIDLEFGSYRDIFTLFRLIFVLIKGRYNIVHGHMGRVGPIICVAGKMAQVPAIILTEHMSAGSHTWIKKNSLRLFFHSLSHAISNNCLDLVIAVSETARSNYVLRQGIGKEKTVVIYNGVCIGDKKNSDRTAMRERLGVVDKNTVVIGMFGRLTMEKGYSDVILAAKEVVQRNKNVLFLVVGEGSERQNLERLVRSECMTNKVTFMGFQKDAADIMDAIDILVQPS